jgi:hypothetical protein|tara:strand:+ start:818 stop:1000 length:183 start_codon:yes stop_codon:yes gene_type:complete
MKEVIANALHKAQTDMPVGQDWNLHSKSACEQLADKVIVAVKEFTLKTSNEIKQDRNEKP